VDVTVADHVQKTNKANFAAAWEEIGGENELDDTFALATVNTLQGKTCFSGLLYSYLLLTVFKD
jgi:hypothetical protein